MTDRREFLQYAMVSAVPLAAGVSLETAAKEPREAAASPIVIRHVVVDARHPESLAFGARLGAAGATVHALADGDATDLWRATLAPAWRAQPVPVAGLTRAPALFILEQLAWAHGLRVAYHAEHVMRVGAPVAHQLHRAQGMSAAAARLDQPDARWPLRIADGVSRFSASARGVRPGPTDAGLLPVLPPGAELLTSWLIAPA